MKHVVLIDDDLFIRDLVATKLGEEYKVTTAESAAVGEKAIADRQTDLLLLDMDLPDKHGIEVLKGLRASPSTANIPVIVFSNNDSNELWEQAKALGALEFIIKVSMDMTELKNRIDELLSA